MSETRKIPRTRRKWIKRAVIVSVILLIAVAAYMVWTSFRNRITAEMLLQDTATVERGDIALVVQAGGNIMYAESISLKAPADGQVEDLLLRIGDTVRKGDAIFKIRNDYLDEEILALEKDLEALDLSLLSESAMKMSSVRSPVSGRVKGIFVREGDDLSVVSRSADGAILISLDDMMLVTLPSNPSASPQDKVSVRVGDSTADGYVTSSDPDGVKITFPDDSFAVGATATVTDAEGDIIGTGEIRVKTPYYVIATSGVVSSIPVKLNKTVSFGTTLVKLEEPVYTASYLRLLESRQELVEKLSAKRAEPAVAELAAPEDGIITELLVQENTEVMKDSPVAVISVSDSLELEVRVDELDISNISVGQTCRIYLFAVEGKIFTGTIIWVAQAAMGQDGISTYPVTVQIDDPAGIRTGMSARTEIQTAEHTDVLLIPSVAIQIIDGKKYVMVADVTDNDGKTAESGRQVEVETGLSNGVNTEIISGLREGEKVILPTEETGFGGFMF